MTETYKGYEIEVDYDQFATNPLDEWTPEERHAVFALKHNRYDLPFEIDNANDLDEYQSWTEFAKSNAPSDMPNYKFVRWYEHGTISVSLRDDEGSGRDWDAGIAGVIFGATTEDIEAAFNEWKTYIEGDIYTVRVTNAEGENVEFDEQSSDIQGYDEALQIGKEAVGYDINAWRGRKNARELHR